MNKKLVLWLLYLGLVVALVFAIINYGDVKDAYHQMADEYTSHPGYPDDIPEDLQDKMNHAWKDYYIVGTALLIFLVVMHIIVIGRFIYKKRNIIRGVFQK